MPWDYDVGVVGLAVPPVAAPVQAYRPAVSVANLGKYPADVTGILRIYNRATGLLLQTLNLSVLAIPAGEERNALADANWVPTQADVGKEFLFTADVETWRDQYLPNNHLSPVTVLVTAAAPPAPPVVTPHASQHEARGTDIIVLDGLHGQLADPQPILPHAATHMVTGTDKIGIGGLAGKLQDAQTPEHHHLRHEPGGDDVVVGVQPGIHGYGRHDETVETTMHKSEANGYASLDADIKVPAEQLGGAAPGQDFFLREDRTWAPAPALAVHGNEKHTFVAEDQANKGQANGYAACEEHAYVPDENLAPNAVSAVEVNFLANDPNETPPRLWRTAVLPEAIGKANGVAPLGADTKVPAENLGGPDPSGRKFLRSDRTWQPGVITPHGNEAHNRNYTSDAGAWSPFILYTPGQVVTHPTGTYVARLPNMGEEPPNPDWWSHWPGGTHGNEAHDPELQPKNEKGVANGYAPLGADAKVPAENLPPGIGLHAFTHQAGGADQVKVDGLRGKLADWQTPERHHLRHEPGGDDPVVGVQPGVHGNEVHTREYVDDAVVIGRIMMHDVELTAHDKATNLEKTVMKGRANGYAPLDEEHCVPIANLPGAPYVREADVGQPEGVAPLDAGARVPVANLPKMPPATHGNEAHDPELQPKNEKGVANGYAPLGADAKVPAANLPPIGVGALAYVQPMSTWSGSPFSLMAYTFGPNTLKRGAQFRFTGQIYARREAAGQIHLDIYDGVTPIAQIYFDMPDALTHHIRFTLELNVISAGVSGSVVCTGLGHAPGFADPHKTMYDSSGFNTTIAHNLSLVAVGFLSGTTVACILDNPCFGAVVTED